MTTHGKRQSQGLDYESFRLYLDGQDVLISDRMKTLLDNYMNAVQQGKRWAIVDMLDRLLGKPHQAIVMQTSERDIALPIFVPQDFRG